MPARKLGMPARTPSPRKRYRLKAEPVRSTRSAPWQETPERRHLLLPASFSSQFSCSTSMQLVVTIESLSNPSRAPQYPCESRTARGYDVCSYFSGTVSKRCGAPRFCTTLRSANPFPRYIVPGSPTNSCDSSRHAAYGAVKKGGLGPPFFLLQASTAICAAAALRKSHVYAIIKSDLASFITRRGRRPGRVGANSGPVRIRNGCRCRRRRSLRT